MAQDFGDDIGEMLFTGFKRSFERAIYDFWRESRNNNRDEEWYRNKFMKEGMSEEDARACIVSGFADNVSKELPLEYALEMNNLIRLEMKGSIG